MSANMMDLLLKSLGETCYMVLIAIVLATLIVIMNLVSDILYKVVDPRITLE